MTALCCALFALGGLANAPLALSKKIGESAPPLLAFVVDFLLGLTAFVPPFAVIFFFGEGDFSALFVAAFALGFFVCGAGARALSARKR